MSGMFPNNQVIEIFGEELLWPGVGPNGKFTNGSFSDPLIKPSFIPAETINLIVDNLQNVIADAGLTPNNIEPDQLVRALRAMFQKDDKFVNNLYSRYDLLEDFPVAASTANVDISVGGEQTIDGISCTVGQLVFLKDQADKRENGFWEVRLGEWRRYTGYTSTTPYIFTGKFILVKDGIANNGKVYYLLDDISVIGTTPLDFKENKLFSLLLKIFESNPVEEIQVIPGGELPIATELTLGGILSSSEPGKVCVDPETGKAEVNEGPGLATPDIHWSRMGEPGALEDFMRGFLRPRSGAVFDPIYADGPAHGKGNNAFRGATLAPNGKVVIAPNGSPNIGIYDPVANTYVDGPAHGNGAFAYGILLPNGKIVLVPIGSPNIGIYDPVANTYVDGPAHGKGAGAFNGATLAPNGKIVLVPNGSPNIGIVFLSGLDVGLGYCLHPYINWQ